MKRPTPRFSHATATDASGRFLVGTSGWIYEDWKGIFYPVSAPKRFNPLKYYARFFNLVEINSSFYRVTPPNHAEKWLRDVEERPDFLFTLKLWQGLTHERPSPLPRREIATIRAACGVFRAASRLGALLVQFPWSFRHGEENLAYLTRLLDAFEDFPCAVEVRHAGWNRPDYIEFLRSRSVAFCNIDQPPLRDCLRPTAVSSAPFSYLRLHGRNGRNWFAENATDGARYDYFYDPRELQELADLARALADRTSRVMVTGNNHFRGQAAANALLLRSALEGEVDAVPSPLLSEFPQLRAVRVRHPAPPEDTATQPDLFG
ncbi:DUF72 domain-containing protein [Candidatus Sumerlaeota bacterium]|nr:DUF72 domain-containing protein [Candidatus Sumerlaeota bacterium]